jgi:hypothetical protein
MGFGLISNCIGLICTVISCLAISKDFDILKAFAYSTGTVTSDLFEDINMGIGLRGVAFDNPNTVGKIFVGFDEFCDYADDGLERYFEAADCDECADVSGGLIITLIISCVTYIPSISTDILRMWPNYDVNCQKVFGSFLTIFSLLLSLYTWQGYIGTCFAAFYDGDVAFNKDGVVVDIGSEDAVGVADFDWGPGTGLILVVLATLLKIIDICAHLTLPTPSITRDRQEQADYETTK